jgi:hypothetical protein
MTTQSNEKRVLALDVHPRSFGFVVFEGPNQILSWGVRSFRPGVNAVKTPAGEKVFTVLDKFKPSAVGIRERETGGRPKKTKILATIERKARSRRIPVRFISRGDVNRAFVGFESNKYEVASALAKQFPALASRLPPKRKIWQSEDYRMGIFDAAAVGVAYFTQRKPTRSKPGERQNLGQIHGRLRNLG